MIEILCLSTNHDILMHLKPHLFTLLEMRSPKFEKFFEECSSFKSYTLKSTWKFKKDSAYFTNHTSYISDKFLTEKLKIKEDDLYENDEEDLN